MSLLEAGFTVWEKEAPEKNIWMKLFPWMGGSGTREGSSRKTSYTFLFQ